MEMERKDTVPKVIQPAENMDVEHNERPPESAANKEIKKRTMQGNAKSKNTSQ